jgi:hypothetical protein
MGAEASAEQARLTHGFILMIFVLPNPDISFETALLKFPYESLAKSPYKLHAIGPYNS